MRLHGALMVFSSDCGSPEGTSLTQGRCGISCHTKYERSIRSHGVIKVRMGCGVVRTLEKLNEHTGLFCRSHPGSGPKVKLKAETSHKATQRLAIVLSPVQ